MNVNTLSERGIRASQAVPRIDLEVYFEAINNLYSDTNPDGALPLNMAENKLCWGMLKDKIQQTSEERDLPDWVAGYTAPNGHPEVRQKIAHFLTEYLAEAPIHAENLAISSGATAVIETTTFLLADSGSFVAFPAPCYPVYRQDISTFGNLKRYDIITHTDLKEVIGRPILSVDDLSRCWDETEGNLKILVLTHPDNPTGRIYSIAELEQIAEWCMAHQVHLIVNEIYGLSLVDTTHPTIEADYVRKLDFGSFATVIQKYQSPYLHLWYALSKDFGISGFRVGILYSLNEELLNAYGNANLGKMVSNHTQWLMGEILSDRNFLNKYISENKLRLTKSYLIVVETLRQLDISYIPSHGSLFVWIDLSDLLHAQTQDAENEFWMTIYRQTGILLTPGQDFGHRKKGQFRIVYTFLSLEHLRVAMIKFTAFVTAHRKAVGSLK